MVEVKEVRKSTRRGFVDWLLGTSVGGLLAAVAYPAIRYIVPPPAGESAATTVTLPFGPDELAPNSAQIFKFGSSPGIIVRTASGDLRAFSAVCTHLSCTVQHRADIAHIWCACHNGHFDLNGQPLSGPPPSPLESYVVNVRDDQIVVSKRS